MKTKLRAKLLSTQRPTFVRMRLKPKTTKTTFKTLTTRPFELKTPLETTTASEVFKSRETKKVLRNFPQNVLLGATETVSSVETISPPSLTPTTVTQFPPVTSTSDQSLIPDIDHRLAINNEPKTFPVDVAKLETDTASEFTTTEIPGFASKEVEVLSSNDIVSTHGREIADGVIHEISSISIDPNQKNTSGNFIVDTTQKNEYEILPAVAIFGGLSKSEQKFSLNEEKEENLKPQPLVMENDIDYANEDVDEFNIQDVTKNEFTDEIYDIETFKPILLNDNQDSSTRKILSMEKDVVTFDPLFEDAFLNKDSMPEIHDINATIEPPPASTSDGANDVHVHEIESTSSPVPNLLEIQEPVSGTLKGNSLFYTKICLRYRHTQTIIINFFH